ncbi:transcriptional repressor C-terminal [Asanoa hainanensis]|uniref:Transcriptional repressor C-terminal n=1 Tax=Asanoa hainanensis TaxID=560556 RepID=A0A239PAC9_9ACTN|nr:transcriptional repressor C-terminal [Asanoa hainanensis]
MWTSDLDYDDTGDVHADLREQFLRSSHVLSSPPIGPAYRALIAEAQGDPALRAAIHERFLVTVEQSTLRRITAAQDAGELTPGVDLAFAAEVLCGTLYYRHLLSTRPVGEEAVDGLLDMFMAAYGDPARGRLRSTTRGGPPAQYDGGDDDDQRPEQGEP